MSKNGFFKCGSCGHPQHTTTFFQCEECGMEELITITEAEYDLLTQGNSMRRIINVRIDLEDRSPEKYNWLYDTIALENTIQERLSADNIVTVHHIEVAVASESPAADSTRNLNEVLVDIGINVGAVIVNNPKKMPDGYDSRRLVSAIEDWAREFNAKYPEGVKDDYIGKIDRFATKKMLAWMKEYKE